MRLAGVDVGGTKTEIVVLEASSAGRPVEVLRRRHPTRAQDGYDAIVAGTVSAIRAVAVEARTTTVGVGMPGGITDDGCVKNSNTVVLNGRRFRQDVGNLVPEMSLVFDNDANCFAVAEARFGAGAASSCEAAERRCVFGVIMGTGVGGGVVMDGRLWAGLQGIAGEWGHHHVNDEGLSACYCGRVGCVEQWLSGPALEHAYETRSGRRRPVAEIAERRTSDVDAGAVLETALARFGQALGNVVNILDPSVIVLGGGVSNLDLWYDEGQVEVWKHTFSDRPRTPLRRAALGDSAGVWGAALLTLDDGGGA